MNMARRSSSPVPYATSLPAELVGQLRRAAIEADVPQAALIRRALRALLGDERQLELKEKRTPAEAERERAGP